MWWILLVLGCGDSSLEAGAQPEAPVVEAPHWVKRSDAELAAVFKASCESAKTANKPILVEFSAPWCIDCKALQLLEPHEQMQAEYANWERVRVDVGRFDRHASLLADFEVRAIANWVALAPEDCRHPPSKWKKLSQRVVELDSGTAREHGTDGLILWLQRARNRL